MRLEVLDVGDGACSILSDTNVMLVDCGSGRSGRAKHSARILADRLGVRSADVDTVVITHFDADHWKGLWELPNHWASAPRNVTIYYPYLLPSDPGLIQVAYLAMQSVTSQTSVTAALDLINSWSAAGVKVTARAIARGDTFRGAGKDWTVHWPPRNLYPFPLLTERTIEALADEIRWVAARNPVFAEAIRRVQGAWFDQGDENGDHDRLGIDVVDEEDRERQEDGSEAQAQAPTAGEVVESLKKQLSPKGWEVLRGRIRNYNNALSVVHTTDTVANFGDCEGVGLASLLNLQGICTPTLAMAYRVVLAPHHGTQIPREHAWGAFPHAAQNLVCQNGRTHFLRGLDDDITRFRDRTTAQFDAMVWETFRHGVFDYPLV